MVDHVVAAEILEAAGGGHHVRAAEVVAHHAAAEVSARLHDALHRLLVRPRHHHDMRGPGLGHHLGLEVAAVHRLEIGHDRHVRKGRPQGPHAMQALGQDQGGARLQPVDAGPQGDRRRCDRLVEAREVE